MESRLSAFPDPPPLLCRYRPTLDLEKGYVAQVLLENHLFAASPAEFNDPFDCRVRIDWDAPAAAWRAFYTRGLREDYGLRGEKLDRMATRMMVEGRGNAAAREKLRRTYQDDMDKIGVLCLSVIPDNLLLWSHYSDKHRGLCYEFEHDGSKPFCDAVPVEYAEEARAPMWGPETTREDLIRGVFFTKFEHWKTEQEWRVIFYKSGPGKVRFEPGALKSVIVGCRARPQFIDAVRELMVRRNTQVPIRQAVEVPGSFKLEIRDL